MPHDLMTECETKKLYIINGDKVHKWVATPVSVLESGPSKTIRCKHCHGEIRIHKRQIEHGPADHAEHRSRADSEFCIGGVYYKGLQTLV
jgi:hypothetical protein